MPIGLTPRLLYSTNDTYIPLLELGDVAYNGLQRLRHAEQHRIEVGEKALVSAEGFLFIATRQTSFVDVVPLDPLQYANVYAAAFADSLEFEMPASILAEQVATAATLCFADLRICIGLMTVRSPNSLTLASIESMTPR